MRTRKYKVCIHCDKRKKLEQFVLDKRCKDGHRNVCRVCRSQRWKKGKNHYAYRAFYRLKEKQAKYQIPINITREEVAELFENWDEICLMCHTFMKGTPTLDHLIPMNRGIGDPFIHHTSNVFIACKQCNDRKRDLPLLLFYEQNDNFRDYGLDAIIESVSLRSGIDAELIRGRLELDVYRYKAEKGDD